MPSLRQIEQYIRSIMRFNAHSQQYGLVMRFYAVPYAALNNYHVDIILFLTGHDKRLRNYEIYVILKVLYSEVQLYKVIEL